jgi:hypothetical protein
VTAFQSRHLCTASDGTPMRVLRVSPRRVYVHKNILSRPSISIRNLPNGYSSLSRPAGLSMGVYALFLALAGAKIPIR